MKLLLPQLASLLFVGLFPVHALSKSLANSALARKDISLGPFHSPTTPLLVRQGSSGPACDPCKRKCKANRIRDPSNGCRKCIPCPPGMKPDPLRVVCIKDSGGDNNNNDNNNDNKPKNSCAAGTVLDPREGPQAPDAQDLKCAIDDSKDCKAPKVPETRPKGKENDASFKPKCLDIKSDDKLKCEDDKRQFIENRVGPDGKADRICKPTRQYMNKKKSRMGKMKEQFKKAWDQRKDDRAKRDGERKQRQSKIEENKKADAKKTEDDKKKRVKQFRCGMATAMTVGQKIAGLITKRAAADKKEVESYMDMVACYFNAEFVESADFLSYWPSDVNVDDIGPNVDEKAYMEAFMQRMEKADFDFWASHDFCRRGSNGALHARCPPKKRDAIIAKELEYEGNRHLAERAFRRDLGNSTLTRRADGLDPNDFCDMSKVGKRDTTDADAVDKRNPFLIFVEIALTAARMAGSLLARVIPHLSSFSTRLANILKNSPKNLFKLAPKGNAGNAGSREAMKQAFRKLADTDVYKQCIKFGKPL